VQQQLDRLDSPWQLNSRQLVATSCYMLHVSGGLTSPQVTQHSARPTAAISAQGKIILICSALPCLAVHTAAPHPAAGLAALLRCLCLSCCLYCLRGLPVLSAAGPAAAAAAAAVMPPHPPGVRSPAPGISRTLNVSHFSWSSIQGGNVSKDSKLVR
jgi:hypothetical protein